MVHQILNINSFIDIQYNNDNVTAIHDSLSGHKRGWHWKGTAVGIFQLTWDKVKLYNNFID